jgi:Domain of unknown function (DUF4336)
MLPDTHDSLPSRSKPSFPTDKYDAYGSSPIDSIQQFGENIWIVDGPKVRDMGILFTTRMVIIKLQDGSLWIDSPVPVSFETLLQISNLGSIRYLIAATQRHVWRLESWHNLFPQAQLWVTETTPFTLKKGILSYTGILRDTPEQGWVNDLDQLLFMGSPFLKEVLFFHTSSHTLILDDLIQIHVLEKNQPFSNALLKLEGVTSPAGGVALDIRLAFTNRKLARLSLQKILSWDFDKLIIGHGNCIEKDAKEYVAKSFSWLLH